MKIIPAIDLIDGRCVRLTQGQYNQQTTYNKTPLEMAKIFESYGLKHLHLVDLDGARSNRIVNYRVLERIASQTNLIVDFGGGLKTDEDLKIAFESGANQVTGGSVAAKQPERFLNWLSTYGADKIILGADCRSSKIATMGWQESSSLEVIPFIKTYQEKGVLQVICTDIAKDGMLEGPSFSLYEDILTQTAVKLIASGGVSSVEDLKKLKSIGCSGAIVGKAIYEGQLDLKTLSELC